MLGRGGFWINSSGGATGGKYVRTTRFASIGSGTSGSVALPSNASVVLNDFGGTVDAVVLQMAGGKPLKAPALTSLGAVVSATFDSSGNYVLSAAPAAYPVAIVYRVQQTLSQFTDTDSDIWGDSEVIQGVLASALYSMGSGTDTFSVVYAAAIAAAIPPVISFINTVDATPIFLQGIIIAHSTTGFTVLTNAPTDSSNYKMAYAVMAG